MKTLIATAAALAAMTLTFATAQAESITYTGAQQIGSIDATYSFTTDGKIGTLTNSDILSYSVVLADDLTTVTLNDTNSFLSSGYLSSGYGPVNIGATTESLYDSLNNKYFLVQSNDTYSGYAQADFSLNFLSSQAQLVNPNDFNTASASESNASSFATAVPTISAAPEPAAWVMMIFGIGAVGAVMRRRRPVSALELALI